MKDGQEGDDRYTLICIVSIQSFNIGIVYLPEKGPSGGIDDRHVERR